jgi:hypothetical protein
VDASVDSVLLRTLMTGRHRQNVVQRKGRSSTSASGYDMGSPPLRYEPMDCESATCGAREMRGDNGGVCEGERVRWPGRHACVRYILAIKAGQPHPRVACDGTHHAHLKGAERPAQLPHAAVRLLLELEQLLAAAGAGLLAAHVRVPRRRVVAVGHLAACGGGQWTRQGALAACVRRRACER